MCGVSDRSVQAGGGIILKTSCNQTLHFCNTLFLCNNALRAPNRSPVYLPENKEWVHMTHDKPTQTSQNSGEGRPYVLAKL